MTNNGTRAGDGVVFAYFVPDASQMCLAPMDGVSSPKPHRKLFGFQRVTLSVNETASLTFDVTPKALSGVSCSGTRYTAQGEFGLVFTNGVGAELRTSLTVKPGVMAVQDEEPYL